MQHLLFQYVAVSNNDQLHSVNATYMDAITYAKPGICCKLKPHRKVRFTGLGVPASRARMSKRIFPAPCLQKLP